LTLRRFAVTLPPMALSDIPRARLAAQRLEGAPFARPVEVVRHLGALQAQDYASALWTIGVRTASCSRADVERAFEERALARSWLMRGTLHVVAAEDLRWMLELLAPRVLAGTAGRRRELGLDAAALKKAERVVVNELRSHAVRTRREIFAALDAREIPSGDQRGYHILAYLAAERVICFGPHRGKEPTFVLLDAWLPPARSRLREHALAELAQRYFASHGPATLNDLAGWAGITLTDARAAIAGAALVAEERDGKRYFLAANAPAPPESPSALLLPGFDEYVLGYKERGDILPEEHSDKIVPGGNGVFQATIVLDGVISGTWRRREQRSRVDVELRPFRKLTAAESKRIAAAEKRYRAFVGEGCSDPRKAAAVEGEAKG
jgi:hypothetical protein